jgi:hypothetical protein
MEHRARLLAAVRTRNIDVISSFQPKIYSKDVLHAAANELLRCIIEHVLDGIPEPLNYDEDFEDFAAAKDLFDALLVVWDGGPLYMFFSPWYALAVHRRIKSEHPPDKLDGAIAIAIFATPKRNHMTSFFGETSALMRAVIDGAGDYGPYGD